MRYGLTTYVGTGALNDPYRPASEAWLDGIDLRPDASKIDGRILVACEELPADAIDLGDSLDAPLPGQTRRTLANALGVNLRGAELRTVLPELLVEHSGGPRRWKPLHPGRHRWGIHLGGERVWSIPVVAGGAVAYGEFFDGNGAYMGSDLTWTEGGGGLERVNDDLQCSTGSVTTCYGRAEHDTDTSDTRTSIDIVLWNGSNIKDVQAAGRMKSSSFDAYVCQYNYGSSGAENLLLRKWVGGTWTNLASPTPVSSVLNPNMRVQVECEGSTIRGYLGRTTGSEVYDDPTLYFTVTDTSITSGTRGGVIMHANNVGDVEGDNFFHRDLIKVRPTVGYIGPGL